MFGLFFTKSNFPYSKIPQKPKTRTATIDFPTNRRSDFINCNSVRIDNEPLKGPSHQIGFAQKWYSMVQKALGEHATLDLL